MTKTLTTVAFFLSAFPLVSYSADLINADDKTYTVFIDLDDSSTTIEIGPMQTISDICDECYIEIDGNPDGLVVEGQEKVVIKNGSLLKKI